MTESAKATNPRRRRKLLAAAVVGIVGAFALLLSLIISATPPSGAATAERDAYADEVAAALDGADASLGERLIAETDCATCHLTGDGGAAPLFAGIATIANERRPPLDAAQYLYEAIVKPAAHIVDGYANAMPNDYGARFSPAELGHMIAYLLTLAQDNAGS